MVSLAGLAFAGIMGLALVIVPNSMAANWRRQIARGLDPSTIRLSSGQVVGWWGLYQTRLIFMAALLEGVIFFALIAYLLESTPWILGVAALFFVGLALLFPTQDRFERWIAAQQELVEQQKRTSV